MKKSLLYLVAAIAYLATPLSSIAQMIGTNCYLQGAYLEIGMNNNGSFGACNGNGAIPPGYHPHMGGSGIPPTGNNLAETYDYGKDGWATGAPPYMGDYTYPGSPFEGWEIQVGAGRSQAFQNCAGTTSASVGGVTIAGSHTAYTNVGGRAIGTWTGTASTLAIRQETRVDTQASWVVVTTVMRNTGAAATGNVYYLRSCDPDNDQTWPGGGFFTNNTIVHQNQDATHRVLVTATGAGYPTQAFMGLGTKDCRARCFIYNSWSISSGIDLSQPWNGTMANATYNLGGTRNGDIGIGLVYNIGAIPAGDSAIVSYAYIFSNASGIDSAFPDPQIVINGVPKVSYAPPTPNYDTFDACLYPGLTSIPVDILYAEDKSWSWSEWTWSGGLGLASTTGVHNTITFAGLPPVYTYTITGTDSATGMFSCNSKIFYLTILTCNHATSNDPCIGDTIKFNAPGDSLGATYTWYGPAPSTAVFATTQATFKAPATMADSGTYTVIKTVAGIPDTSTTHVTIYALPVLTVSSTQIECEAIVDPLTLNVFTDSICIAYAWTGPLGFTSTDQNPVVSPFDSSMAGIYSVIATSDHGCKNDGTVLVKPGPVANFTFDRYPGCPNDTVTVVNTSSFGVSFEWNYGDGTKSFDRHPVAHNYTPSGTDRTITLTATASNGCTDVITKNITLNHNVVANFDFLDDTVCNGTPVQIVDLSSAVKYGAPVTPLFSHFWSYEGGHTDNTNGIPADYTFPAEGYYNVTLTVVDSIGCENTVTKPVWILQPYINALSDSTFCLTMPMTIRTSMILKPFESEPFENGYEYSYMWSPSSGLNNPTEGSPVFTGVGNFVYTLTATMNYEGCVATHVMTLNSTIPQQLQNVTRDSRISYGGGIRLNADSTLFYTWAPNDGSLDNPNINNPIATPTVTTTYTVYGMDFYGCKDTATVTIVVDSTADEFIPSGFTPNGDGLNDVFRLKGSKFHRMVEFRIFNRWGEQVFYTTTRETGWDGTFNGEPAPLGVYYYTVIVSRPGYHENTVYKGDVTLIR